MQKWKAILFASVKVLLLTAVPLSSHAAEAQDFCDTSTQSAADYAKLEEMVRAKCKVGDIIVPYNRVMAARLCDLSKPAAYEGLCFLAPPRKTY